MKKILFIIALFGCLQFFTSCENWFDVNPKSLVKNDVLFEDEGGFKTALFGIYTSMATSSLYGQELTMSFMDVLAQYYTLNNSYHRYNDASIYNYDAASVQAKIGSIWSAMYKTIMNCNNLLENMEGNESLFSHDNYKLIRGEALGLRAYMHFDLLRMYAPAFAVGENEAAIPYVDKVVRTPFPQLTNAEVVRRVLEDCETALNLLKDSDPFGPAGGKVARENDAFLENRDERMNYYAVKALMARVCLWAGKTTEARGVAGELVSNKDFGVTSTLFKLYSDKVKSFSDEYFTANVEDNFQLPLSQNQRKEFYETGKYESVDGRVSSWLVLNPKTVVSGDDSNTGRFFVNKYSSNSLMPQNVPLLRMVEMYYIYAECQEVPADRLTYLNTVRRTYGIPAAFDLTEGKSVFDDELFKEYRKSFLAEGQLFFYLKRRDVQQIPGALNVENPRKVFSFPLPDTEKEFGILIKK